MLVRYNTVIMKGIVTSVRVERLGLGTTTIDPQTFKNVAGEPLAPFRDLGSDRPHFRVEARMRKRDIRQAVLCHLNAIGELYPEE